jgi:hypothetical protein
MNKRTRELFGDMRKHKPAEKYEKGGKYKYTKNFDGMGEIKDGGFWITGYTPEIVTQGLKDYCKEHPEKWVYTSMERAPRKEKGSSVPVYVMQVSVYDKKPTYLMIFWDLYQKGCEGLEEPITDEIRMKHMKAFYIMGQGLADLTEEAKKDEEQ